MADDYRQILTNKLIEQLEAGTAPWQKPWDAKAGISRLPYNPTTGKEYRGANSLYLSMHGRSDPRWATYKQAAAQGWQVRKGEKGALVEYWKFAEEKPVLDEAGKPEIGADGKPKTIWTTLEKPQVFRAVVFNAEQMDNVPELKKEPRQYDWDPVERAEKIIEASGAKIYHDQNDRAFYSPARDEIHMPGRDQFPSQATYYSTALHELGHWTGHESRLGRDLTGGFGSSDYAKEELRAELSSYFMADKLGIHHDPGQHAAYVKSWVQVLKDDKNEIFRAAKDAEKITDFVMQLDIKLDVDKNAGVGLDIGEGAGAAIGGAALEQPAVQIGPQAQELTVERTLLDVPFKEKEAAKAVGAKWDKEAKTWYAPPGVDLAQLARWRIVDSPAVPTQEHSASPQPSPAAEVLKEPAPAIDGEKTWLAVPFKEKEGARAGGAKWDKEAKAWYAPPGIDLSKLQQWLPKQELAREAEQAKRVDPAVAFGNAIRAAGLVLDGEPKMDGTLHRVAVADGKAGNRHGAYVGYLDGRPAGYIQNFQTGEKTNWKHDGVELSAQERAELAAQAVINKQARAAKLRAQHEEAAGKAQGRWERAQVMPQDGQTPYLARKQVAAFGVRQDGENLLIPVRDIDGKLWAVQTVFPEKKALTPDTAPLDKVFTKEAKKEGNFHLLGEIQAGQPVITVEGYATGASVYQATGYAVAVAFDSGNIEAVVGALKERYPTNPHFIGADDDRFAKPGREVVNAGLKKAIEAAHRHDVGVIVPAFSRDGRHTDFNDLHVSEGLAMVKSQIEAGVEKSVEQSREAATNLARNRMGQGTDVNPAGPNTRHTGEVLDVNGYHATQATSTKTATVHQLKDLDKLPKPGQIATIQYQQGRGKVTEKAVEKSKELQR